MYKGERFNSITHLVGAALALAGGALLVTFAAMDGDIRKIVIGVGVKQSTSDLLTANCDEFIFYDDLVRDTEKPTRSRRKSSSKKTTKKKLVKQVVSEEEKKKQEALDLVIATLEDLFQERGETGKLWSSMVKQTLKRRKPGFNERYHGFSSFSKLLEEAQARKLLVLEADEKSGGYMIKSVAVEE